MDFKHTNKSSSNSFGDLFSMSTMSPSLNSLNLLSTESLNFVSQMNISITSEQCMLSDAVGKEQAFQSLRQIILINTFNIDYKQQFNDIGKWRQNVIKPVNKYLQDGLQKMIIGVVRLGIGIQRKIRFAKHKAFIEIKNYDKDKKQQDYNIVYDRKKQTKQIIQKKKQPDQKKLNRQILDRFVQNIEFMEIKYSLDSKTKAFSLLKNYSLFCKKKQCQIKKLVQTLSQISNSHLLFYFDILKSQQKQFLRVQILMNSISYIQKNIKGYFLLNTWNTLKKLSKKPIVLEVKKERLDQLALKQQFNSILNNTQHKINRKQQKIEMDVQTNYNTSFPITFKTCQNNPQLYTVINENELNIKHQQFQQNKKQKQLTPIIQDVFIKSNEQSNRSSIFEYPVISNVPNIPNFPSASSMNLNNNLSPKYNKKPLSINKKQKVSTPKQKNINFLKKSSSPLLTKQIPIVNQYYISNHEYIPTFKKSICSPQHKSKNKIPTSLTQVQSPRMAKLISPIKSPKKQIYT